MLNGFVLMQHMLPKRVLTECAGRFAAAAAGRWTQWAIRRFVARYGVDLSEADPPDPAAYPTFNAFFTRALRPGARPVAEADWVCPVDGSISQFGSIAQGQIVQAKGHTYSTQALLGGEVALAEQFAGGWFATLYLSPRDYHRIHMPCAGRLQRMIYIPGALYSVNPKTVQGVAGLFARNERVVCLFQTAFGPLALVLVGATIVGSIATVWHGQVNASRASRVQEWCYASAPLDLAAGQEMGRFLLGSTVVLLGGPAAVRWAQHWAPGVSVRMGEPMAQRFAGESGSNPAPQAHFMLKSRGFVSLDKEY